MITAELVKNLREKTGAGMMDCKKVLTETNGDLEKAVTLLRERGIAKAAKKSDRITAEGIVIAYKEGNIGVLVEVNAETDFVSKNDEFRTFAQTIAKQIAKGNQTNIEALLEEKYISEPSKTVKEVLTDKIATIGENIGIRRFVRFESNGLIESYVHGDGKIGVLVEIDKDDAILAKDICMQVAAAKPEYLNREEVPQNRLASEFEVLKAQAMNEGKPEAIAEKMVQGRIGKFYAEICLLEQAFVKNPDITIQKLIDEKGIKIIKFARFEKGEGIEKKQEDFAAEVMKQIK